MNTRILILFLILGVAVCWSFDPVYVQAEETEEEEAEEEEAKKEEAKKEEAKEEEAKKEEGSFAADKGQAFIDVSDYPKKMQEYYKVFAKRCGKCHTLARPVNSKYTGKKWKLYVKRMMRKPGSGINPKNGKKIVEFLIYDSEVRKKGEEKNKQQE